VNAEPANEFLRCPETEQRKIQVDFSRETVPAKRPETPDRASSRAARKRDRELTMQGKIALEEHFAIGR